MIPSIYLLGHTEPTSNIEKFLWNAWWNLSKENILGRGLVENAIYTNLGKFASVSDFETNAVKVDWMHTFSFFLSYSSECG